MANRILLLSVLLLSSAAAQPVDIWSRPVQTERVHDFDVLHYRILLDLSPSTRSFAGQSTVTLRSLTSRFDSTSLDAETFVVTGVRNDQGIPLRFRQVPGRVTIFHERSCEYGDTVAFTVMYRADSVDVDEERFGMSRGYDLGLGFKPATTRRSAIVNTLSFPTGARHWFPCYDHPNDKATTEVIATVDSGFVLLSNGELVSVRDGDRRGTRTWHWYQRRPHSTYLTVLIAGDYVVLRDSLGTLPVNYWVYRSDESHGRRTFGRTPEILAFYEEQFGIRYPWTKYDQITIPGIGGGAESTTATVIGESAVVDERAELDWPSDWLVAHEAAHQWWGNYVTMRDWGETWMNESFATYYEYVWALHSRGEDEGAWNMENKRRQYFREAETKYRRPIVFNRWTWPNENFDSHTYPKGAAVLHMLRTELGAGGFDSSISHFLRTHPYASVDTRDLIALIRDVTGRNMQSFFDQWVYSAGHPDLRVSWVWDEDSSAVRLTVRQVHQRDEHVGLFSFPVDVELVYSGGGAAAGIVVSREVETFTLASPAKPRAVRFDTGNVLLAAVRYECGTDENLVHLAEGDVIERRKAIERLSAQVTQRRVRDALMKTGESDPFWRLRAQAVEALGVSEWNGQEEYFLSRLADTVSGVRAAAVRAVRSRALSSLVPRLISKFDQEPSYLVQSEIVRTVGALDREGNRAFLERAKGLPSYRSVLENAATEALGGTRK